MENERIISGEHLATCARSGRSGRRRRGRSSIAALTAAGSLLFFASSPDAQTLPLRLAPLKVAPTALQLAQALATDRIIVRLRDDQPGDPASTVAPSGRKTNGPAGVQQLQVMSTAQALSLSAAALIELTPVRRMGSGAHVMRLDTMMRGEDVAAIVERLRQDPMVVHAEPDRRKFPLLIPNDPFLQNQWNLLGPPGGINAEAAWNLTQGSAATVVAVLDTGILGGHREFALPASRLLAGFDFIGPDPGVGGFATANDGSGRDADPSDPGDWITSTEAATPLFAGCPVDDSSWHGTYIAGIIGANSNNGVGIAGVNWFTRILPVRVLGKCGGYTSDTLDALRWAAGLSVPSVPANPTPAHVVNLSLGGAGQCSVEEQSAINAALAAGVRAIVAAAGNDGGPSLNHTPGNCNAVVTVTATDINGSRPGYASVGTNVALAAPGGFFTSSADALNGVLSLSNTGVKSPAADAVAVAAGTSGAAAHVSGVVSLMLVANPALTPYQVYWVLRNSARAFPNSTCTTSTCGAGIVDALAAVQRALTPPPTPAGSALAFLPAPSGSVAPQMPPPASGSAAPTTPPPTGTAPGSPLPPAGSASAAAPGNASSVTTGTSGGGGCAMRGPGDADWTLVLLASLALVGLTRRRRAACADDAG